MSERNKTISLSPKDITTYKKKLIKLEEPMLESEIENRVINQDIFEVLPLLPDNFVDLMFIDHPYNRDKQYNSVNFKKEEYTKYCEWLDSWISQLPRILKGTGSVYFCSDWQSSIAVYEVARKYFRLRNRITWERDKGRGCKDNWKNNMEDIWYFTKTDEFTFNLDSVKVRREVIAPYTNSDGTTKDWDMDCDGKYRLTCPSNIWTDITVPFWSMAENTPHPTQKPEKLVAKVILASSNPGDIVFDPFMGSGTSAVVAKKLGRKYVGVEMDPEYCLMAEKRLDMAEGDKSIQGYVNGQFLRRNE